MKRLFVVIALVITLIGSAGLCFAEVLDPTGKAGDWLKAAKLPSHEIKEGSASASLLTDGELKDLLIALGYAAGYMEGVIAGVTTAMQWGVEKTKVSKYLQECPFVNSVRDAYDEVRNYLIANPSARNVDTFLAFAGALHTVCRIKKE